MAEKKKIPEIRFNGFSENWKERKLGELADIIGGGTPSTSIPEYWDGDIDWYSPTEIGKDIYANGSIKKITSLGFEKSSAKMLPPDKTVLFTSRAGIGDMAILNRYGATNQGFQSLVLRDRVNPYFIYSAGNLIKKYALKNASGSTFLEISGKLLGNMEINIPSTKEQSQIGTFFKHLDSLITLNQRKYDKLVTIKKSMLEKMFPKNGATIPEIRFKGFTEAWEEHELGDVVDLLTGYPFESKKFAKDGIFLARGMNVKRGYLDMKNEISEYWPSSIGLESYLLKENDILIQMDGALIGKSYAKIGSENLPALLVQRVTRIRSGKVNCEFIYPFIQRDFLNYIQANKTETAVPHLSLNDIKSFRITTTSNEEQTKIGSYFKHLDNLLSLHQGELEKLKNIKKAMLEKMFV